ncbi:hypothetical protein SpAn4DRAFT_3842 [Sporomusa ovata]|uniref:Uncharacterized protein n=1 Tax=Sporomusa ovata TaxID=2378 RepID=A0A0U1KV71_9FIRM|nr:hypothetical protein SpAn4DRAFT_3842 [Sporomusa ovata]
MQPQYDKLLCFIAACLVRSWAVFYFHLPEIKVFGKECRNEKL